MRTRWRCLRVLAEPVRVEESASFAVSRSAAEVWDFMWDPRSLLVLEEGVTAAMTLPGTPAGRVGEVQVSVRGAGADRHLVALEVVALEPGRMAYTRTISDPMDIGGRLVVEPTGESSCRMTQTFHQVLPEWMDSAGVDIARAGLRQALAELEARVLAHFAS